MQIRIFQGIVLLTFLLLLLLQILRNPSKNLHSIRVNQLKSHNSELDCSSKSERSLVSGILQEPLDFGSTNQLIHFFLSAPNSKHSCLEFLTFSQSNEILPNAEPFELWSEQFEIVNDGFRVTQVNTAYTTFFPENADFWYKLGMSQMNLGQTENALFSFNQALFHQDNLDTVGLSDVYFRMGSIYHNSGVLKDIPKALSLFDQALSADEFLGSYNLKTSLFFETCSIYLREENNYELALENCQSALQIDEKHFWSNIFMSEIQYSLGNTDDAIKYAVQATEIRPNEVRGYQLLLRYFDQLGDNPKTLSFAELVLQINPDDEFAKKIIDKLASFD